MTIDTFKTSQLTKLPRISSENLSTKETSLLLPPDVNASILDNDLVLTEGLGELDKKQKDLLQIITINDALTADYDYTNVLSPRTYLQSIEKPLPYAVVQCILLTDNTPETIIQIENIEKNYSYNKTDYDKPWISTVNLAELNHKAKLIIMNRRIGGWDGSPDRPVIELLGAGGHTACHYTTKWESQSAIDTAVKEVREEIGLEIDASDVIKIGGFLNTVTQQLVILFGIKIAPNQISQLQKSAYGNTDENTDGLYFGEFENVMQNYLIDASPFAGGEKAKTTNFPSNSELMKLARERLGL